MKTLISSIVLLVLFVTALAWAADPLPPVSPINVPPINQPPIGHPGGPPR